MPDDLFRPETKAYSVAQACELLGVGRNTLRALIEGGRLRVVRVGRRILVPANAVVDFLAASQDELDF